MMLVKKMTFRVGLVLCCLTFAGNATAAGLDNVVARMGGVELRESEVRQLIEAQSAEARRRIESDTAALERLVRKELVRRAVLQEARQKEWDKRPEIAQKMEIASEQVMLSTYVNNLARPPAGYPSEEEIKVAYKDGKDTFNLSSQGKAAQIYVAPSEVSGKKTLDPAQTKVLDTITPTQIKQDSSAEPTKLSNDSSPKPAQHTEASQQHDVAALPEKRAAQPDIKNGEISTAIRSGQGWHIEMKTATPSELADVREKIVQTLRWRKAQENEGRYLQEVASRASIEINQASLGRALQTLKSSVPEK